MRNQMRTRRAGSCPHDWDSLLCGLSGQESVSESSTSETQPAL